MLPSTVNLFGKDNLLRLELISCLIPFHEAFARVTPLFKHGERSDIDNYRPISVISIIRRFRKKPEVAWKRGLRALRPLRRLAVKTNGCGKKFQDGASKY